MAAAAHRGGDLAIESKEPLTRRRSRFLITLALCGAAILGASVLLRPTLGVQSTKAASLMICTVIAWTVAPAHPAVVTLLMYAAIMVMGIVPADVAFRLWTTPVVWMMVGSFLIARATVSSGLARRVAIVLVSCLGVGYARLILASCVVGIVLGLIIPHPFPRTVLIWSVYRSLLESVGADATAVKLMCFGVFASAVPTSMLFLTSDSVLNVTAASLVDPPITWTQWLKLMAVPSLATSCLMVCCFFVVFGPDLKRHGLGESRVRVMACELGPMTQVEKKVLAWCALAAGLWATAEWHGINPAWVSLICAGGLALPVVGEVLTLDDVWVGVNWPTVLFVAGAATLGTLAQAGGLTDLLVDLVSRIGFAAEPFRFLLCATIVSMAIHVVVGSALASLAVAAPLLVLWGARLGVNPAVCCLTAYIASNMYYVLPFHHSTILVGQSEPSGFGVAETLRFALPLMVVTLASVGLFFYPWWQLLGVLNVR
ncbi:MAG: SLC13 family permease [Bacillota bacterium]